MKNQNNDQNESENALKSSSRSALLGISSQV